VNEEGAFAEFQGPDKLRSMNILEPHVFAEKPCRWLMTCFVLLGGTAWAANEGDADYPTFIAPSFPQGEKSCSSDGFAVTFAPDNRALSLLRSTKSPNEKPFLAAGTGYSKRDRAQCFIEINLAKPLPRPNRLMVDLTMLIDKMPQSLLRMSLVFGAQAHFVDYGRGRVIDQSSGRETLRFVIPVSSGIRKIPVKITGVAMSLENGDLVQAVPDTIDLCFIDPDRVDYCGVVVPTQPPPIPQ
jgi:hypothetical protein